ncbi:hypothetical protein BDV97DRAFT_393264 [Delphinella strobiligena]|nr:hypothetical protein BDV97DRAFT_393264 [Delphinella strobiligena]
MWTQLSSRTDLFPCPLVHKDSIRVLRGTTIFPQRCNSTHSSRVFIRHPSPYRLLQPISRLPKPLMARPNGSRNSSRGRGDRSNQRGRGQRGVDQESRNSAEVREINEWASSRPRVPFHASGLDGSIFARGGDGGEGSGNARRTGISTTTRTGSSTTITQSEVSVEPANPARVAHDGLSGAARSALVMARQMGISIAGRTSDLTTVRTGGATTIRTGNSITTQTGNSTTTKQSEVPVQPASTPNRFVATGLQSSRFASGNDAGDKAKGGGSGAPTQPEVPVESTNPIPGASAVSSTPRGPEVPAKPTTPPLPNASGLEQSPVAAGEGGSGGTTKDAVSRTPNESEVPVQPTITTTTPPNPSSLDRPPDSSSKDASDATQEAASSTHKEPEVPTKPTPPPVAPDLNNPPVAATEDDNNATQNVASVIPREPEVPIGPTNTPKSVPETGLEDSRSTDKKNSTEIQTETSTVAQEDLHSSGITAGEKPPEPTVYIDLTGEGVRVVDSSKEAEQGGAIERPWDSHPESDVVNKNTAVPSKHITDEPVAPAISAPLAPPKKTSEKVK